MKIKTVIIAVVVMAAAVGGIGYGVYYAMQGKSKPVNVVPVANVNYSYWGDDSTIYGTIVSMSSQNVRLESDYELVRVYVETGDEVKIGDPLLEYDMTLVELQRQIEDLSRQILELNLESMQKELEKLRNTTPTASLDISDGTMTASADGVLEESQNTVAEGSGSDNGNQGSAEGSGQSGTEGSGQSSTEGTGQGSSEGVGESGTEGSGQSGTEDGAQEGFIEDGDSGETGDISGGSGDAGGLIEDSAENDGLEDTNLNSEETLTQISDFLTRVNQFSTQELDQLIGSDISEALRIYREELAEVETREIRDVLGEIRTQAVYTLKPAVASLVGESTAQVLAQAYDRACVYQLIYCVNQLNPEGKTVAELSEQLTDEEILQAEASVRLAADAYYALQQSAFDNTEYQEWIKTCSELLGVYVERLNRMNVVEETEADTEDMTEPNTEYPWDDYGGGDYDGGDGLSYTADELKEAIADQERDIAEQELQIRESELKLKQYDRQLDNKIIKSTMNGVVKSAGTVDEAVSDEDFIVITGAAGMYVRGTLNELSLETVSIGDAVQGTSYEDGMSFTATITEISQYPEDSENGYYGFGSENSNASYYPFLAYIEEADGLSEGDAELQILDSSPSTGIYLENYFIRTEVDGKKYVYLQGSDGLLTKQYVETGKNVYGSATEIKSGVTREDKIAFPYGDDVKEGAQTKEVDNLYTDTYY